MKKSEKIAEINNILVASIAAEKAVRAKAEADYRGKVATLLKMAQADREKATDDPDEPQECDQPIAWLNGEQWTAAVQDNDQPTQWLNGEQWSCAAVARRILKKLPKLNSPKESFNIEITPSYSGGCSLSFRYINIIDKDGGLTSCELISRQEPEEQAQKIDFWLKEVEVQMDKAQEIMREEADNE